MYSVYMGAAVGILFAALALSTFFKKRDKGDKIMTLIFAPILGALFGLLGSSFVKVPNEDVSADVITLASMRSSDSISGAFVWGTGSVGGELIYHVYVKNADGSLTPYQIYGDSRVRIVEDDTLSAVGYWTQIVRRPDTNSPAYRWSTATYREYVVAHVLRVPTGTVQQSFSVR